MSGAFPRLITITRAGTEFTDADGLHATETPVAADVPADIQFKTSSSLRPTDFPAPTNSDAPVNVWKIFCQLPLGTIKKADKVTDDLGETYQVDAPAHNGIMYELICRDYKP
jgi:hypothetical protein